MGYTLRGVDSAISYHGFGTDDFNEYPVVVTDKLPVGCRLESEPVMVGVLSVKNAMPTDLPNTFVTPIVDAILNTIVYNKYSEQILNALRDLEGDAKVCEELHCEAMKRGIRDLYEWELKEMEDYFS